MKIVTKFVAVAVAAVLTAGVVVGVEGAAAADTAGPAHTNNLHCC